MINKKGVISLSGLSNAIAGLIGMIPKPIKFLIFLLLIVFVGSIIGVAMQIFGFYCNSADQPVQLSGVFDGISLLTQVPDPELLNQEVVELPEYIVGELTDHTACSLTYETGEVTLETGETYNLTDITHFYVSSCVDCIKGTICWGRQGGDDECKKNLCVNDAVRISQAEKSFYQKLVCGRIACEPPEHYYWESSQDLYTCADESCAGITMGQRWDELLRSKDATLLYPEVEGRRLKAENAVGITCTELSPRLGVFGLDILDYRVMILILLLMGLFWLYRHLP